MGSNTPPTDSTNGHNAACMLSKNLPVALHKSGVTATNQSA